MSHFVELVFNAIRDSIYPQFSILSTTRCTILFDVVWVELPEGHGRSEKFVRDVVTHNDANQFVVHSPSRQYFQILCDDWSLFALH